MQLSTLNANGFENEQEFDVIKLGNSLKELFYWLAIFSQLKFKFKMAFNSNIPSSDCDKFLFEVKKSINKACSVFRKSKPYFSKLQNINKGCLRRIVQSASFEARQDFVLYYIKESYLKNAEILDMPIKISVWDQLKMANLLYENLEDFDGKINSMLWDIENDLVYLTETCTENTNEISQIQRNDTEALSKFKDDKII